MEVVQVQSLEGEQVHSSLLLLVLSFEILGFLRSTCSLQKYVSTRPSQMDNSTGIYIKHYNG